MPAPYGNLQAVDLDNQDDLEQLFTRLARKAGLNYRPRDKSLLAKKLSELWQANSAASSQDSPAAFGSRIDEHLEICWVFRESQTAEQCWAGEYIRSERILATAEQVDSVTMEFTPSLETVSFVGDNSPRITLQAHSRSSPGQFRIAPTHASSGRFAFRINFDPALQRGDTAEYTVKAEFPAYKWAVRERLVKELMEVDAKVRDYDFVSRKISRPCNRLTYRISIPRRLKAIPLTPEVLMDGQPFLVEQQYILHEPGVFEIREEEIDGEPHWTAILDRMTPPNLVTYRLRWLLPRLRELEIPAV